MGICTRGQGADGTSADDFVVGFGRLSVYKLLAERYDLEYGRETYE